MAAGTPSTVALGGRPPDLPDFERPPLVEVVVGIQFSDLRGYRTYHSGLLWKSVFRGDFPICEERPPLDPVFETFGGPKALETKIKIEQLPGPPVPRIWFVNSEGSELVQIQSDRLTHNWRRFPEDQPYPRYERIRERFFAVIGKVQTFFKEENIGTIEPNQCEIAYVNHIGIDSCMDSRELMARVFKFWTNLGIEYESKTTRAPCFEDSRFLLRLIINGQGKPETKGRLYIQADPAIGHNGQPIVRLMLTARGYPNSPDFGGVRRFLDFGRENIVRAFADMTTSEMHDTWGRIR